jgi:glucose-6-phosphate isomerase
VLQQEKAPLSLSELADKMNAREDIESIYIIVRHLHANRRFGIVLEGDLGQPDTLKVSVSS